MEASRVQPEKVYSPAHDAINRLLYRLEADSESLWKEASAHVSLNKGLLLIDDSTLDKPYSREMELVGYCWSGKHHRVVKGINVQSLIWSDGDSIIPTDYRIYDNKDDHKTKNDLFREMASKAFERGFKVEYFCFDSWYSSLDNLKFLKKYQQQWLTRIKSNRLVNPDDSENVPISSLEIGEEGKIVHLRGYGMIKVFKIVAKDGDIEFWATNNLDMNALERLSVSEKAWSIEMYHRGLKQNCGVEKCQCLGAKAQRNHIQLAIRTFLRLERFCFAKGISWMEAKLQITRNAIREYIKRPFYNEFVLSTA